MVRRKQLIRAVGRTQDGRVVVEGVFRFCETEGVPLTDTLSILKAQNAMPSWLAYFREALEAKMTGPRILSKLDEALTDTYGAEFRDVVLKRLGEQ